MSHEISLTNHFLIAMPTLLDPNFQQTVSYICEHNEEGTMGIIINRPTDITLADLCEQLDITIDDPDMANHPVYHGGPVETERGFILHSPLGNWESTLPITKDIGLTLSIDIIESIAGNPDADMPPENFIITLGYAGWGEEQIEDEILENSWLSVPANSEILFHTPIEQRWTAAAATMGINLNQLSTDIGHA
jgi:putative transcriptional regulator